jgi:hypothetical protein
VRELQPVFKFEKLKLTTTDDKKCFLEMTCSLNFQLEFNKAGYSSGFFEFQQQNLADTDNSVESSPGFSNLIR